MEIKLNSMTPQQEQDLLQGQYDLQAAQKRNLAVHLLIVCGMALLSGLAALGAANRS